MRSITAIIVHHTDSPEGTTVADVDRWHRAKGWSGIGYHWLVHRLGLGPWTVSRGRSEEVEGAHDQGQNRGSIGVAIAGRYSQHPPTPGAWWQAVVLLADICRRFALDERAIEGHGEHEPPETPTECPGALFDLDRLRSDVALVLRETP